MDRLINQPADDAAAPASRFFLLWLIPLLGLFAWQGWMTLTLFGQDAPWQRLLDDAPVISGNHPLHMYHGGLGAQVLQTHGTSCCYDPNFYAGYPKTPVFDSGSRPAELFFFVSGGRYRPAAYKIGLAVVCCLVPFVLLIAARSIGLGLGGSCLAVGLGLLVWWGTPARRALEAGDLDLLIGGLAVVTLTGLLVHFHRAPGLIGWLGLLCVGWLGWFSQPAVLVLLQPLVLIYYLSVGSRHQLGWHIALVAALTGGLAGNAFWLLDWAESWWIRQPIQLGGELLAHRTIHTVWSAAVWGSAADRNFGLALIALGVVGAVCFNQTQQRPAARTLTLGSLGLFALALAGLIWEPVGRIGTAELVAPALWFSVPLAVYAVVCFAYRLGVWVGAPWRGGLILTICAAAAAVATRDVTLPFAESYSQTRPLVIGLSTDQSATVQALETATTRDARILWEDHRSENPVRSHWPALLATLTDRVYIGGLDPNGSIEHSDASLVDGVLAKKPMDQWSDSDLDDFCRRYNVGWVVCWSKDAVTRWRAYSGRKAETALAGGRDRVLFTLTPRSYVLKGHARLTAADARQITLTDVVPEDGEVVLSLHYQSGMQASPSRVRIERQEDAFDPIDFIRLAVPAPVARVTLSWDGR